VCNPQLLTSGYSTDITQTGDNSATSDLAGLRTQTILENGTATVSDYYESTIVRLGLDARANTQTLDV
jgi:flagellar hook-associated protein FlgK